MTWYAYCADGTLGSETFNVPIRAKPIVCSIAAARKTYIGGILSFWIKYPEVTEPRGEQSISASNRQPALNAERSLTTWNLWGMSTTAGMKMAPPNIAFL